MPVTNKCDSFRNFAPSEAKTAQKIARNSWRYTRADGAECVRLHNTDVVVTLNGQTTFNSGGWRTVTTKDRMNCNAEGFRVYSDKGRWYVRETSGETYEANRTADFFDGITLPRDFAPTQKTARAVKSESATLKAIDGYLKKVRALDALPMPNNGDCWVCSMFEGKVAPGSKVHDAAHLMEHIREGYIHGALIVNAMRWAGYQDNGIGYWFHEYARDKRQILRVLRRFLKAQLGVGAV